MEIFCESGGRGFVWRFGFRRGGKSEEEKVEYSKEVDFAFDCSSTVIIERLSGEETWYSIKEAIQSSAQVGMAFKPFCMNLVVGIRGS